MTMTKESGIRAICRSLLERYEEQGLRIPELRAVLERLAEREAFLDPAAVSDALQAMKQGLGSLDESLRQLAEVREFLSDAAEAISLAMSDEKAHTQGRSRRFRRRGRNNTKGG